MARKSRRLITVDEFLEKHCSEEFKQRFNKQYAKRAKSTPTIKSAKRKVNKVR